MIPLFPPAQVEVDDQRRYIDVNQVACELLGYSREELLGKTIEDLSYPSGAHVPPMYAQFIKDGAMDGIFALQRKTGEIIRIRFRSGVEGGRLRATWPHYELLDPPEAD